MFHVPDLNGRAPCADRLDLVDAGYTSPGRADELRALCARCPIAATCLAEAMARSEDGVWGGTSPNLRARHGALKAHDRLTPAEKRRAA